MKIKVGNIPLHAFQTGIVEVPDGTPPEAMNSAIGAAIRAHGFKASGPPESHELNETALRGDWEFSVESIDDALVVGCSHCNAHGPGNGSPTAALAAGWGNIGHEHFPAWRCATCRVILRSL